MLLFKKRKRRPADPISGDLVLGIGDFIVSVGGVRARLRPPLERLSNYYPWQFLPFGLNAMRILVDHNSSWEVHDRLVQKLGLGARELDWLDGAIGYVGNNNARKKSDSILNDTDKLMQWSFAIADRCPDMKMANDLRMIRGMDTRSRDQHVAMFLG